MRAGAASCLSVGKHPLDHINLPYSFSVPRSEDLPLATFGRAGRPWDREGVGARHAAGSGGGTSFRAWHRRTRLPKAGAEAPSWGWGGVGWVGREKEVTFWQASPSPPPYTRALLVICSVLCGSCGREPDLIHLMVPVKDVWKQFTLALILRV